MKMTVSCIRLSNSQCNVCVLYIAASSANYQDLKEEAADKADIKPCCVEIMFSICRMQLIHIYTLVLFSYCSMITLTLFWAAAITQQQNTWLVLGSGLSDCSGINSKDLLYCVFKILNASKTLQITPAFHFHNTSCKETTTELHL